MAVAWKEG
jgi:NOL1/NOP2/fmu family ribosome biogenesis protein